MKTIYEYFKYTVNRYQDKVAVDDCNEKITFKELDCLSRKIGSAIIEKTQYMVNNPILVYLPKTNKAVSSFLGIHISGNFYVPIDMKQPDLRIDKIRKVMKTDYVITLPKYVDKLVNIGFPKEKIMLYDELITQTIADSKIDKIQNLVIDTDPLYVKFTSGSSGEPKGVILPQRAIIDYIINFKKEIDMEDTHISGSVSPFHFDNSVHDIYAMVFYGSTLVIIPDAVIMFPVELIDIINQKSINVLWWPTSALVQLATSKILETYPINHKIEIITNIGEVLQTKYYNQIMDYLPHTRIYNIYGPTETAVASTYYYIHRKVDDTEIIPIGKPFQNTDVFLLDETDKKVTELEQCGEVCIRGSSLALGYYNNKEKSEQAFVQNPLNSSYSELIYRTGDIGKYNLDGDLIYIGRKDFQIKHKGQRIELGEIEMAVSNVEEVNDCCSIYSEEEEKIILFYVSAVPISNKDFMRQLVKQIPKYMFPDEYLHLEQLPQNANGKIDRVNLKKMYLESNRD